MSTFFKPILYSTPMVIANLEGRKRMTRRTQGLDEVNQAPDEYKLVSSFVIPNDIHVKNKTAVGFHATFEDSLERNIRVKAKYAPGDILWVRETIHQNGELGLQYKADGFDIDNVLIPEDFKARTDKNGIYSFCDIPNIFMLKSFARIFLEVTNVRCERLRDISEADAIAEGIEIIDFSVNKIPIYKEYYLKDIRGNFAPENSFRSLWKKINGKDSWEANPWVWVYEYKKIEKPEVWPR